MGKLEVAEQLRTGRTVVITGHLNPDGDSLACMLALGAGLEQLGKQVSLQSHDPVPNSYHWLPGVEKIEIVPELAGTHDIAVLLECSDVQRAGFERVPAAVVIGIDHHPDFALAADADWVDVHSASTAELIHELLIELGCSITQEIARTLLTGIVTDSGFFAYEKTSPRTLETAAALMRCGGSTVEIMERVYRSLPALRLDLMADLLASLKRHCGGAFTVMSVDRRRMSERGYSGELFEEMVNIPLSTHEVHVSLLARQSDNGIWRCSMRSKGSVDIGAIAREYGGGGHHNAAGFRADGELDEIIRGIIPRVEAALQTRQRQ